MNAKFLALGLLFAVAAGCSTPQKEVTVSVPKPVTYDDVTNDGKWKPDQPATPAKETTEHPTAKPTEPELRSPLFKWAATKAEGLDAAKKSGGLVLLKFEATWCGPCKVMTREAFQSEQIAKTLKNVVVVPIDVDSPDGQVLATDYKANEIPMLVFLNKKGATLGEIKGYTSVEWLDRELNKILTAQG